MNAGDFFMSAWAGLVAVATTPADRQPTRVGLLNSGELVLVDAHGAAQVISKATTEVIRTQLIHTDFAASELVLFPQSGALGSEPARSAP